MPRLMTFADALQLYERDLEEAILRLAEFKSADCPCQPDIFQQEQAVKIAMRSRDRVAQVAEMQEKKRRRGA